MFFPSGHFPEAGKYCFTLDAIKDNEDEPLPRSIDVDSYAAFLAASKFIRFCAATVEDAGSPAVSSFFLLIIMCCSCLKLGFG